MGVNYPQLGSPKNETDHMSHKLSRWCIPTFLIVVCSIALIGCGPLPQPFRGGPSVTSNSPLLDIPTAVGIAVLPIKDAPEPFGAQLSAAIAERLRVLEIPAEAVPYNAGLGFSLEGHVNTVDRSQNGVSAKIVWTLKSRAGALSGTEQQKIEIPETAWLAGDTPTATRLGENAALAVLAMLGGDVAPVRARPPSTVAAPALPSVSVRPVESAPGDGRESLMLAVIQSLTLNGVHRDDIDPDVILNCKVVSTPYNDRLQRVEIIWRAQLRDGTELGTMKLDNTIPVGSLNGPWGSTAFAIADAAAPDLLNLLASAPEKDEP